MIQVVFICAIESGTPCACVLSRQDHILFQLVDLISEVNLSILDLGLQL